MAWPICAAANVACTSAAITAAIAGATNGQTITVNAGSMSLSSAIDIPSTVYLTLNGSAGCTITSPIGFTLEPSTLGESRITGFTFTGASTNPPNTAINVNGSTSSSTFRIDHNTFNNSAQSIFIAVGGNPPGLIDNNNFTSGGASEQIHNLGAGAGSNAGWVDNVVPGGPNMLFIEDNTFTDTDTTFISSAVENFYGSRTVIRYNTFIFSQVDMHGTAGSVGGRWWEVYNNTFNVPGSQNQCCAITARGGSGVVFNNTKSGTGTLSAGNTAINLYEEDTGAWPLAYQVGSGINGNTNGHNSCTGPLNSAPMYLWGNGSPNFAITTFSDQNCTGGGGGECVQSGRDFIGTGTGSQPGSFAWQEQSGDTCSTTYAYTPYTYPHPLQNLNSPSASSGFQTMPIATAARTAAQGQVLVCKP